MNKVKVDFENYVKLMEESLKEKAVIVPHIRGSRIVDFGAGSGSLLMYIKSLDLNYKTIAIDNDEDMRDLARTRGIDAVYSTLSEVKGGVDTIIFNSVLHEVYSYGDRNPRGTTGFMKEVKGVLAEAERMLLPGGRIVIRDGFLSVNKELTSVRVKTTDFDVDGFIKEYPYGTKITRQGEVVTGPFNDVKEFLNKLTWGKRSIEREIQEKINFLTADEWGVILKDSGYKNIRITFYTQPSYFFYLQKVAEIKSVWPTHILITAEKGE